MTLPIHSVSSVVGRKERRPASMAWLLLIGQGTCRASIDGFLPEQGTPFVGFAPDVAGHFYDVASWLRDG